MKKDVFMKKMPWFLFLFILLIGNALYWCAQKEGYYIDELWSYGLSNGYYTPFLYREESYMNHWHQPTFYEEYLMVQENEIFSYGSVYSNQVNDVHPPLYYVLLHTICSLFPNEFSKWFGLALNLLCYAGAVFLLYRISGIIVGERSGIRLLPPLLYGMSVGAVATLIYIRMYMLLTLIALLLVYLSFLLMRETRCSRCVCILIGIGVAIAAGFLTQYYFLIFAFFFSFGYVICMIWRRRWRMAAGYLAAAFGGIITAVLIFPASLFHIFHGYQGKQAFANAFGSARLFFTHWKQYQNIIMNELIGEVRIIRLMLAFFAGWVLLIFVFSYLKKQKNCKYDMRNPMPKAECFMLFVTVLGYFSVIVQISPEVSNRYQFILYPFCTLLAVAAVWYLCRWFEKESAIRIVTVCMLALTVRSYALQSVPYVYSGYWEALDTLGTEYRHVPGIYVTAGDHLLINNCLFLAKQDRTYALTAEQIQELPEICPKDNTEHLIVYVDIYYDEIQTAQQIGELLGYDSCELLYDNTFTQIFVLSR